MRKIATLLMSLGLLTIVVMTIWVASNVRIDRAMLARLLARPVAPATTLPVHAIVEHVHAAGELTTVIYATQAVVHVEQSNAPILDLIPIRPTEMIYGIKGDVRAGIDLRQVSTGDIRVNGGTVEIVLPPPQIFSVSIQPAESNVMHLDQPWWGGALNPAAIDQAQQQGIAQMRLQACEERILDRANTNAIEVLAEFLNTIQVDEIILVTQTGIGC
jgi:hypothetical protein